MIRRPPRSTRVRSSAASDVYKRQDLNLRHLRPKRSALPSCATARYSPRCTGPDDHVGGPWSVGRISIRRTAGIRLTPVSYTHLRAHETVLDLVCRLLLEKKKK